MKVTKLSESNKVKANISEDRNYDIDLNPIFVCTFCYLIHVERVYGMTDNTICQQSQVLNLT